MNKINPFIYCPSCKEPHKQGQSGHWVQAYDNLPCVWIDLTGFTDVYNLPKSMIRSIA